MYAINRHSSTFEISDFRKFKIQLLNWLNQFNSSCFLDNQQYESPHHTAEILVGAGIQDSFTISSSLTLYDLQQWLNHHKDWVFGHINYDLKNYIHPTQSLKRDAIQFPELVFFVPNIVIQCSNTQVTIASHTDNPSNIFQSIIAAPAEDTPANQLKHTVEAVLSKEEYISVIEKIKKHIQRGDCYEINFCQEFFIENCSANPVQLYNQLASVSPNPFAAYYRQNSQYLICASPERYIKKSGNIILSQPIKGTLKRNSANLIADEELLAQLRASEKDKSENVMVVDLVRNDLSKICKDGTVLVTELFGIYSFPQVHQMISSIEGTLLDDTQFTDILRATFPMGSMTGAPKIKVMELIEQYEAAKRGIFSGAVGYITPTGDFDFNVVIRSIMYNTTTKYLSYLVGSGITFYSNPEDEYEECMLKAKAIETALGMNSNNSVN